MPSIKCTVIGIYFLEFSVFKGHYYRFIARSIFKNHLGVVSFFFTMRVWFMLFARGMPWEYVCHCHSQIGEWPSFLVMSSRVGINGNICKASGPVPLSQLRVGINEWMNFFGV